jgi:hypothetical protein
MIKPIVGHGDHVLVDGGIAHISIKQIPGVERHIDLIAIHSPRIVFVFPPYLVQQVIRDPSGSLAHILPKVPQKTDIVVVRYGWLIVIPGHDAATGICLYIMVDNVTLIDCKVPAILCARMIAMDQ